MGEKILPLTQSDTERERWKRTLTFLQQENILLKNKLAEILRRNEKYNDVNLLDAAEQYQSEFLQQDEALRFMWNDLVNLECLISRGASTRNRAMEINLIHDTLRTEIENLQIHFNVLRNRFKSFFEGIKEVHH